MGGRHRVPKATLVRRLARGRRFDRNPLRRASDRAESLVLLLLALVFLAGAPFAALLGGAWAHGMALRAQHAQRASLRQVTAVVLAVTASSAGGAKLPWQAQARWRAPDGREVTHEVPVPSGLEAGGLLRVWTDRAGDLAAAPLLDSQVAGQAAVGEMLGVAGAAGALILAGVLTRWSLNMRRMAAWEADWQATGPRWTTLA
jgi:hypothetical protein